MPIILAANNAQSTIAGSISNTATSVNLAAGTGILFPSPSNGQYFVATLISASNPNQQEIIWVTGKSTDTLTIVRAQEGTTGQAFNAGDLIINQFTEGTFEQGWQGQTYAGNPNGNVAGTAASGQQPPTLLWDTTDNVLWVCSVTGNASSAVWVSTTPGTLAGPTVRLTASLASAGTTITFTADEIGVAVSLGGAGTTIANLNQALNVATTGANGMDTGTAPTSGFVSIYAIWNPQTGVAALLGTTASQSTIYGGSHMPTGYTMSALIAVWPTNSSAQLVAGAVVDRKFIYGGAQINMLLNGSATTPTQISLSSAVPTAARTVLGQFSANESSSITNNSYSSFNNANVSAMLQIQVWSIVTGGLNAYDSEIPLATAQKIWYYVGHSTVSASMWVTGYSI
jgi:hypothetical protein